MPNTQIAMTMKRTLPEYLAHSGVQDRALRYTWDDINPSAAYEPLDDALLDRLSRISQRANVAFAIACAEWVVHRLGAVAQDSTPSEYLEAAWAGIVDAAYTLYYEPDLSEWEGPARMPLAVAMILVADCLVRMEDDDHPEFNSASLAGLAEHLLADAAPFRAWRETILTRLELLYPLESKDTRGSIVPREALDPDYDFRPEEAPKLITKFLQGLDFKRNAFLRTPQMMQKIGFEGVPYSLP